MANAKYNAAKEIPVVSGIQGQEAPTTESSVPFIPREAIKTSEEAKKPKPEFKVYSKLNPSDPFGEDRVSETEPSMETVESTPPDRTVNPG